jgi:hypothetical protein
LEEAMSKRSVGFIAVTLAFAATTAPSASAVDIEPRPPGSGPPPGAASGLATAVAIEDPNIRPGLVVALARVAAIAVEDPNIMPGFGVFTAAAAQSGR